MSASYGKVAFTPSVQQEQERHGSRRFYARHTERAAERSSDALTDEVRDYLRGRDSFYLASVGATGWPYVQFRGGPPGFLTPLSDSTVGWADFRGNLQYITTGNVHDDNRVALIVMSYPTQERLKIYGRAAVHEAADVPEVVARLVRPDYDAVVERAVVVTVEAYDWNCQQHITPRFTVEEIESQLRPLHARMAALEADNARLRGLLDGGAVVSPRAPG